MYMKPGNGLDQGFENWKVVEGISFDSKTDNHVTSHKLTPLAIEMLTAVPRGKRFFMYLHYMDPHDQYMSHQEAPKFGNKPRDRYDQEMFYTDLWIGKLIEHCKKQPWWEDTAVVVSADHGEAFGEHKMARHAFELWDMLTQVPLFVRLPGVEARRIDVPRGHIDLAPTLLELTGVSAEHDFVGKSLVPELYGAEKPEPRPVVLDLPADSNNPERHALVFGDYKLLVFERGWRKDLYNLAEDPGETTDLAKKEPEKFSEMVALWEKTWAGIAKVKPYGGTSHRRVLPAVRATNPTGEQIQVRRRCSFRLLVDTEDQEQPRLAQALDCTEVRASTSSSIDCPAPASRRNARAFGSKRR
jgi:arylsulfatase A-like enzyme